jgi:hypothetical protein
MKMIFFCNKNFRYQILWWMLFQKRVARTKFNIYVFIGIMFVKKFFSWYYFFWSWKFKVMINIYSGVLQQPMFYWLKCIDVLQSNKTVKCAFTWAIISFTFASNFQRACVCFKYITQLWYIINLSLFH